jgi:DHA2 family multidrug resistance protein
MVVTGVLLLAGLALLPPLLQTLFGYSVLDSGFLTAPRGLGTLASMMIAGRLTGRVDARVLIFFGISCLGFSLYQMAGFTLVMGSRLIIISGVIQGFGLGFIFVPLQSLAFASLPASYRTTGAALLNLCRNIGGSVGISVVTSLLARNVQVSHADLAAHVTEATLPAASPSIVSQIGLTGDSAMAMLNAEINRQALMIAYIDDFYFMMILTLCVIPLLLLLKKGRPPEGATLMME